MPDYRRLYENGGTYFFTVVTYNRRLVFQEDDAVALLRDCLERTMRAHPFVVEAQVVLPDHLHTIWTLPDGDCDFSMRWNLVKGNFSRRYEQYGMEHKVLPTSHQKKREQVVWQRRFWEHLARDQNDFNRLCDYAHYNPVKHSLVRSPADWNHSTFREFLSKGLYLQGWGAAASKELRDMSLE